MARDLFNEVHTRHRAPARSAWTIAGSIVAHIVIVSVALVVPILSAFDQYVVQARPVTFLVPPAPVMPAMPAAPPPQNAAPAVVPNINPHAAPTVPPQEPVKGEVAPPGTGRPVPDGWIPGIGTPTGVPGAMGPGAQTTLAPPPPREPIRPGGDIKAPTRVVYVEPVYPRIAIAAKVEGFVIIEATIDEAGVVRDARVLRSTPLLDQAAVDAVMKWRYTPTRLNGQPVPILLTVTVMFTLR